MNKVLAELKTETNEIKEFTDNHGDSYIIVRDLWSWKCYKIHRYGYIDHKNKINSFAFHDPLINLKTELFIYRTFRNSKIERKIKSLLSYTISFYVKRCPSYDEIMGKTLYRDIFYKRYTYWYYK
jgi:hypothetical protein